jgi:uncharacterized protein (DUF983 family)
MCTISLELVEMKPIKPETNPYELSSLPATDERMADDDRDLCPACRGRLSRWRVWNTIRSARCDHCGEKVWLELRGSCQFVLTLVGSVSYGLLLLVSEYSQIRFASLFLIVPLPLTVLTFWMQITYGKIVSANAKRT